MNRLMLAAIGLEAQSYDRSDIICHVDGLAAFAYIVSPDLDPSTLASHHNKFAVNVASRQSVMPVPLGMKCGDISSIRAWLSIHSHIMRSEFDILSNAAEVSIYFEPNEARRDFCAQNFLKQRMQQVEEHRLMKNAVNEVKVILQRNPGILKCNTVLHDTLDAKMRVDCLVEKHVFDKAVATIDALVASNAHASRHAGPFLPFSFFNQLIHQRSVA